jgi:hypothetical protein
VPKTTVPLGGNALPRGINNNHESDPKPMTSATTIEGEAGSGSRIVERRAVPRRRDSLIYLLLVLLIAGVWQLSRLQLFDARSEFGYWMGVVGGVLMLLLFAYPLRKRWQVLARFGKAKYWFIVHMVLGIGGPLFVLAHCAFRVGSLNAGVALFSMLIVAASGVVGRFIYLRIHRGLGGERETLEHVRQSVGLGAQSQRSRLRFAPLAEARLRAFEKQVSQPSDAWRVHFHRVVLLPIEARAVRRRCCRETDRALGLQALGEKWSAGELREHRRRARELVRGYTGAVVRVAQFSAFVRLFSLWHVLHVPFVYLMVVCAIFHVVAVHAY